MKYLTFSRFATPPTAEGLLAASEWVAERRASGLFETAYMFVDGGAFSIQEASSAEEITERMLSHPLAPTMSRQVRLLIDPARGFELMLEAARRYEAFPGAHR